LIDSPTLTSTDSIENFSPLGHIGETQTLGRGNTDTGGKTQALGRGNPDTRGKLRH